jgi:GH24 family phage-related lysozyme (muramidase)
LLKDDINKAKSDLDEIFKEWDSQGIHVNIDQQMYDSMVSMIYNMGIGKFRNSKFIQHVKRGEFINAAKAIDVIDNQELLNKYPGLVTRRSEEKNIFSTNLNIPPADISEVRKIIRNILKENIV